MSGSERSRMTRSGFGSSRWRPSTPSAASTASWPSSRSRRAYMSRVAASSSMARMRRASTSAGDAHVTMHTLALARQATAGGLVPDGAAERHAAGPIHAGRAGRQEVEGGAEAVLLELLAGHDGSVDGIADGQRAERTAVRER